MPTTFEIPARKEHRCAPCEFHECTGSLFVRSGEGSWKQYECRHPGVLVQFAGTIVGRNIGKTEKQPDWCPLNSKNRECLGCGGKGYNTGLDLTRVDCTTCGGTGKV